MLFGRMRTAADGIGAEHDVRFGFERFYESPAAVSDAGIQDLVEASARDLGLTHRRMPSGAGHDAQSLAPIGPLGMIFVPSADGISHAPGEYTSPAQITNGANVLLRTLLGMDRTLP